MKRTAELKAKLGEGFEEDEARAMLASYPEDAEKLKQTEPTRYESNFIWII